MTSGAEKEIRELISKWKQAVRNEDFVGIRSNHAEDFLMFDVPPPFQSRGLDAYMETWRVFYESQARPITFYLDQIVVTVGDDVAFATAVGTCGYVEHGEKTDLKFRLTMGSKKEMASGSSSTNTIPYRRNAEAWIQTQLEALQSFVREGDTVFCHSMDRLAATLRRIVLGLTERSVHIVFVT